MVNTKAGRNEGAKGVEIVSLGERLSLSDTSRDCFVPRNVAAVETKDCFVLFLIILMFFNW